MLKSENTNQILCENTNQMLCENINQMLCESNIHLIFIHPLYWKPCRTCTLAHMQTKRYILQKYIQLPRKEAIAVFMHHNIQLLDSSSKTVL